MVFRRFARRKDHKRGEKCVKYEKKQIKSTNHQCGKENIERTTTNQIIQTKKIKSNYHYKRNKYIRKYRHEKTQG